MDLDTLTFPFNARCGLENYVKGLTTYIRHVRCVQSCGSWPYCPLVSTKHLCPLPLTSTPPPSGQRPLDRLVRHRGLIPQHRTSRPTLASSATHASGYAEAPVSRRASRRPISGRGVLPTAWRLPPGRAQLHWPSALLPATGIGSMGCVVSARRGRRRGWRGPIQRKGRGRAWRGRGTGGRAGGAGPDPAGTHLAEEPVRGRGAGAAGMALSALILLSAM